MNMQGNAVAGQVNMHGKAPLPDSLVAGLPVRVCHHPVQGLWVELGRLRAEPNGSEAVNARRKAVKGSEKAVKESGKAREMR